MAETPDLPSEEWRVIEEFPDYAVSNMGRVRRLVDGKAGARAGKIMRSGLYGGHLRVTLTRDGMPEQRLVARLMVCAFRPGSDCWGYPRYLDGNPRNVTLDNIVISSSWGTLSMQDVRAIRAQKAAGVPMTRLAERYHVSYQTIVEAAGYRAYSSSEYRPDARLIKLFSTFASLDKLAIPLPFRLEDDGTIYIGDTSVTLDTVEARFGEGYSPEDIVSAYPSLDEIEIYPVCAFLILARQSGPHQDLLTEYLARQSERQNEYA